MIISPAAGLINRTDFSTETKQSVEKFGSLPKSSLFYGKKVNLNSWEWFFSIPLF